MKNYCKIQSKKKHNQVLDIKYQIDNYYIKICIGISKIQNKILT